MDKLNAMVELAYSKILTAMDHEYFGERRLDAVVAVCCVGQDARLGVDR